MLLVSLAHEGYWNAFFPNLPLHLVRMHLFVIRPVRDKVDSRRFLEGLHFNPCQVVFVLTSEYIGCRERQLGRDLRMRSSGWRQPTAALLVWACLRRRPRRQSRGYRRRNSLCGCLGGHDHRRALHHKLPHILHFSGRSTMDVLRPWNQSPYEHFLRLKPLGQRRTPSLFVRMFVLSPSGR